MYIQKSNPEVAHLTICVCVCVCVCIYLTMAPNHFIIILPHTLQPNTYSPHIYKKHGYRWQCGYKFNWFQTILKKTINTVSI